MTHMKNGIIEDITTWKLKADLCLLEILQM